MDIKIVSLLGKIKSLWEKRKKELEEIQRQYKNFTGNIYILSDWHIPYVDKVALEVIDRIKEDKTKKIIVINGDFVDFEYLGRFLCLNEPVDLRDEIEIGRAILEKLVKNNDEVLYIKSNHELRLDKFLARLTNPKVVDMFRDLGVTLEEFFKMPQIKFVNGWFIKIGDCLICHPEIKSIVRARAGDWVAEYFETRIPDVKCFFIGHTHSQSKIFRKRRLVIETGCLCKTLFYAVDSKFRLFRTEVQYLGYGIAKMLKGKVDLNSADFVVLKAEDLLLN